MMSGDGSSSPLIHHDDTNPNSSNSAKRKRNLPDPDAEIIGLSPRSLMATNRFVCEICSKGFQRDQNLQLHKRGHNLPWKLKQRNKQQVVRKKVYICPEKSCVHHDPSRALGDLTGVKKHFSRKHGEKKWKCEKCSKKYAVQSDWKAHSKICGTKEYRCHCGTLFSRKDSFITHRAFCDTLTEENSRLMASFAMVHESTTNLNFQNDLMMMMNNDDGRFMINAVMKPKLPMWLHQNDTNPLENSSSINNINGTILSSEMVQWLSRSQESIQDFTEGLTLKQEEVNNNIVEMQMQLNDHHINYNGCPNPPPPHMSATALLQKASQIGSTRSTNHGGFVFEPSVLSSNFHQSENSSGDGLMMAGLVEKTTGAGVDSNEGNLTRDFLGVEGNGERRVFSLQQELMRFTCSMNDSSIGRIQ